jgi:hypothetical protein
MQNLPSIDSTQNNSDKINELLDSSEQAVLNENEKGILPNGLYSNLITSPSFLEAVGLFEIVGSKWMLAVDDKYWDAQLHEHCFDEVTHAKLLQDEVKKLRWSMTDQEIVTENKVSKVFYQAIDTYLSKLSRKVFKLTVSHGSQNSDFALSAYTLLSFVIERRIMTIYPYFAKYGPTESLRKKAKRIISDERKHLHFVGDTLPESLEKASIAQSQIIEIEEELSKVWIGKMVDEYNKL